MIIIHTHKYKYIYIVKGTLKHRNKNTLRSHLSFLDPPKYHTDKPIRQQTDTLKCYHH